LGLFLTALVSMVFVSQQYDQYQTQASRMSQYDIQRLSEYLVANPPGLTLLTSGTVPGWGPGCGSGGTYNCYNMTVSNLGGVGVRIVRIYINSTGSGCTALCVLNPTLSISSYAFNQANQFVNPGEVNHALLLALPIAVTLPNPNPAFPRSTILVATTRGNVFSFQWPFQTPIYGPSSAAASFGLLKVAYQQLATGGYDSIHDYSNASGHTSGTYCHNEPLQYDYPMASNYAEKLTVSGGNTLYFVNPWVTEAILKSAVNLLNPGTRTPQTQMYIYAVVTNTLNSSYTVSNGTIDLTWYSTDHIDGILFGLYYQGQFYPTGHLPTIAAYTSYYAIYKINQVQLYFPQPNGAINSVMFWGGASLSTTAKDTTYFSGTLLSSGLWIRASC